MPFNRFLSLQKIFRTYKFKQNCNCHSKAYTIAKRNRVYPFCIITFYTIYRNIPICYKLIQTCQYIHSLIKPYL